MNSDKADHESRFALQVFTLVLWLGCLIVGGLGFVLPYVRPKAPTIEPMSVQAELLNVELTNDPLPPETPPASTFTAAPPPPNAVVQPHTVQPVLIAEPSAAIAFALPVAAQATTTDATHAGYSQANPTEITTALPPVQTLTFGRGECRQPAPEYPLVAKRQGQQGAVKVRFTVGEDGRVVAVETLDAAWPLLKESSLRAVRHRWKFSPGKIRRYEVMIRFQLNASAG